MAGLQNPFEDDKLENPFKDTKLGNPFGKAGNTALGNIAYKAHPIPKAPTMKGVDGMDDTSAAIVHGAQRIGGNALGDTTRTVIQAPMTFVQGFVGGMQQANAGFNQMLRDYTPIGALPVVGDWLQDAATAGYRQGNERMAAGSQNYQTAIGRDVGSGISSLGATAPLVAGVVATRNPAILSGGGGLQTGLTEYAHARDSGVAPLQAANYALGQGAIETGTEMLPAGALVDAFKAKNPVASLIKKPLKYVVGEGLGEQVATLGQNYMQGEYIDSRTNPNWQQDFVRDIPANARSTAIATGLTAPGNVAIGGVANAARETVDGVKAARSQSKAALKNPFGEPDVQQSSMPIPAAKPAPMVSNSPMLNAAAMIRQRTQNGGMQTRRDIPQVTGQSAIQSVANKIIGVESGGKANSKNPSSSASGVGQFINSTWLATVKKHRPDIARGSSDAQILALKTDPKLGREMTIAHISDNAAVLQKSGLPVTDGNLYLVHFLGAGGAVQALKNGNKQQSIANLVGQGVMNANSFLRGKSIQDTIDWAYKKMGSQSGVGAGMGTDMAGSSNTGPELSIDTSGQEAMQDAADNMQQAQADMVEENERQMRKVGKQVQVYLDNQMQPATMGLVEADDLAPTLSNAANQYRDRNRAASQLQVNEIANNLQPELVTQGADIGTGAPTLASDGKTIIGGNGRVLGIAQAYNQGMANQYKQYLMDNAQEYGLKPSDVAAMQKPVLVRNLNNDVDIAKAAVASNESGGLGMSSLEQARVDADRLPDFGSFTADDSGEINIPSNREYIRSFVNTMPANVQSNMVDAGGMLSQDGVRRLRNAMLYRAYGNSPSLSRMVESTNQGARNMVNAMIQAAPTIARARDMIKDGAMHDADISSDVVQAVEKINQLRDSGQSVSDYLSQQGLFADDLTPTAHDLVQFLDEHKRSAKAISTLLTNYYSALEAQGNPAQVDVFENTQAPNEKQLLNQTVNDYERQNGKPKQSDIFAEPKGRTETTDRSPSQPRAENQPQSSRAESDGRSLSENQVTNQEPVESQVTNPSSIDDIHTAVMRAVGRENARHIAVIESGSSKPNGAQSLNLAGVEGWYDPRRNRVTLVADNLTERSAALVAWHELGHRGIHVAHFNQYQSLFKTADRNETVSALADAIRMARRGTDDPAVKSRIAAVEEAAVELFAAMKTGDYAAINSKYADFGFDGIPAAMQDTFTGWLTRFWERVKDITAKVLGQKRTEVTDADVYALIGRVDADVAKAANTGFSGSLDDGNKYSRTANTQTAYEQRIDELFDNAKPNQFEGARVLDRSDMLDMLGYGDMPVILSENKVRMGMDNHPLITREVWKKVPEWIDNPAMVFDSDTGEGLVFIAPEQVANRPVRIIMRPKAGELQTHLLLNTYDASESSPYMRWTNERLLRYVDTKKAPQIAERFGRQLPIILRNPAFAPSAQIHGMGRGDAKALKLGKILTEKNLQGYRKNNSPVSDNREELPNDLQFSRQATPTEKKAWGDLFNEVGEFNIGVMAYNKIADLIKPVFGKVKLANTADQSFTEYMRDYRAQLNAAGMTAKDIADAGVKMTPAERRMLSEVLEKELPDGAKVTPEMQELSEAIREVLGRQSDDLVALKMLSPESADRFRDTYLPRIYAKTAGGLFDQTDLGKMNRDFQRSMRGGLGKTINGSHLKGRGIFKEIPIKERQQWEQRGFEVREDKGNGKLLMWRDYTRTEREQMGEERDAMLRFTSGYIKTQADVAKGMLFQRISKDESLASQTQLSPDWVHIPESDIAGTGGVKRYGALAGMWVHPEVAYHLQQQFYIDSVAQKVWRSVLGWWKVTNTVYNPVAHMNNVMSNIVMTFAAGGRLTDLPAMAKSIKTKDALYREALEQGIIGDNVDVAGIQEMFVGLNNASDEQMLDGLVTRAIKRADKLTLGAVGKSAKLMQNAYRVEDEVFKLALYKMAKDKGLSPRDAANYALTFMFDYSEIPQGIKWVRDTGILPFVSYTYKAIPAVARLALTRPHRMLVVTAFMYAMNALSYAMLGDDGDEDEEREYMPDYQKGFTVFGTPKLIRLPWNDSKGKPIFLDVYRWLPLGDFADVNNQAGGLPIPNWITPNGPIVNHFAALVMNTDTFTGDKMTQEYQSTGEKAAIYGKWLAQQWLPASVTMPGSYHFNNVMDGMKNKFEGTKFSKVLEDLGYTGRTYRGQDKQFYRAGFGALGIKLRGEKPEDQKAALQRKLGYQVREIRSDMSRIRRDSSISADAKKDKLDTRKEQLQRLFDDMPKSR